MDKPIVLAAVAGAFGVRGEVRLKLFAQGVESLKRHRNVEVGGRTLTIADIRQSGAGPVVRFAEISDRGAAEALRGAQVCVARDALPALAADEYYHADLIGMPCQDAAGAALGMVVAVENFGAGDIIEIEKPGGARVMVPFKPGVADPIDGRIVVDPAFLA